MDITRRLLGPCFHIDTDWPASSPWWRARPTRLKACVLDVPCAVEVNLLIHFKRLRWVRMQLLHTTPSSNAHLCCNLQTPCTCCRSRAPARRCRVQLHLPQPQRTLCPWCAHREVMVSLGWCRGSSTGSTHRGGGSTISSSHFSPINESARPPSQPARLSSASRTMAEKAHLLIP